MGEIIGKLISISAGSSATVEVFRPSPGRGFVLKTATIWTETNAFPKVSAVLKRGEEWVMPTQGEFEPSDVPLSISVEKRISSADSIKVIASNSDTANAHYLYVMLEGELTP